LEELKNCSKRLFYAEVANKTLTSRKVYTRAKSELAGEVSAKSSKASTTEMDGWLQSKLLIWSKRKMKSRFVFESVGAFPVEFAIIHNLANRNFAPRAF
jgi:hypothetical protein